MKINSMDANIAIQQPKVSGLKLNDGNSSRSITLLSDMEKAKLPLSEKTVIDAIEKANKALNEFAGTALQYSVHEKTNTIVVKIIDKDTKEVIKEIPPEKMLDMVAKLMELSGIVVDERR